MGAKRAEILFGLLVVLWGWSGTALAEGDEWLPSDPLQGRIVFEEKHCITCHSIAGSGGNIGPDLVESRFYGSFLDLAAVLWNHVPDMDVEYENLGIPWPSFSDEDVRNLIAYLYYLRYLGDPGSVSRGKKLLKKKGCIHCHRVGKEGGGTVGPPLDRLKRYASPIYMVQAIWNHGPRMQKKMEEMGIERPSFTGQEIADLSAYIRAVSEWEARERVYLSPGDPRAGKEIFEKKGCVKCHRVRGKGGALGPSLDEIDLDKSVTEIAGMMWNHGEAMWSTMKEAGVGWPTFEGKEMADLIAFLYFIKFADPPGDPARGRRIFAAKQCLSCHSIRGVGGIIGPDLAEAKSIGTRVSVLRAMLNHAPKMAELVLQEGKVWPTLTGQDLRDIIAYLQVVGVH
jgi:mono/diheme cytochrome c family protein